MASPAYLTIKDDQGNQVKANVQIKGRVGTAEVLAFDYHVDIPSDKNTGALTAVRKHGDAIITKTYDASSPVLFDACCRGKTLQSLVIDWYRINDKGEEEVYFTHQRAAKSPSGVKKSIAFKIGPISLAIIRTDIDILLVK